MRLLPRHAHTNATISMLTIEQPADRNTSAAAATAAGAAFLGRAQSQTGLSSAAAAAALRSHTTSPEPVGSIQTKRMVRRGSQSSVGSASVVGNGARGGVGRAGLQRNNSSGSMSERTFRSPSPGRANGTMSPAVDAPPVPSLPTSLRGSHRRSASTEPPQRMMSPTPRGNRGVSVDRAGSSAAGSTRRLNITLPDVQEVERQGSVGSVNFSRPISAQGHSPITAPASQKSSGSWFGGPTGTLSEKPIARPATADGIRPKRTQATSNATATQTNGSTNQVVAADPIMIYDPASRKFVAKSRTVGQAPEPPSPVFTNPQTPKPGEYDPHTRTIVPALPPQQPSIVVTGGDNPVRKSKPVLPAVDTQVQPPPRNPARNEQSLSPASPRAAGILQKQPSIVREDPEGEEEAEGGSTLAKSRTRRTADNSVSPIRPVTIALTPTGSRNRSESLDVPRSGSDSSGRGRGNSNSPARSARFSATPIMEVTRHDPPERGISPAKSAMKHSPSSSIRTGSPMALATSPHRKAMSDTSDTPSVDGIGKKKKSVRVSFTEQPQEIESPNTPYSHASAGREVSPIVDDDMDEIMKPRPALPSFGSVRQSRVQQEVAEKVTERPPDRGDASSDHAIGGILAQGATNEQSIQDPAPPEVTSKDGPTYSSDESEDETAPASELDAAGATAKAAYSEVGHKPEPLSLKEAEVAPEISLQPPTPGEEEKKIDERSKADEPTRAESPPPRSSLEKFVVPGGWTEEEVPASVGAVAVDTKKEKAEAPLQQTVPSTAPKLEPSAFENDYDLPTVQLSDIAESDSDDSAIFSDAAEDLSDLDETGFASLDAIVESPAVKPKPKQEAAPDSPSLRQAAKRSSKDEQQPGVADWSQATSYWRQLSKQQREQIERSHLSSDDEYRPAKNPIASKPKKKKSALKQPSSSTQPEADITPAPPRPAPTQAPKPAMRTSMRAPAQPTPVATSGVQMRSSLREGGGGMKTSLRNRPQSEVIASKTTMRQGARPMSTSGSSMPTAAAGGAMSQRPQSPRKLPQDGPFPVLEPLPQEPVQQPSASANLAKKMPPLPPAEDSDSESSFKKKRRSSQQANVDAAGKYNMRRSMRAMSMDSEAQRPASIAPSTKERKAFSVRSLSPTGSLFGRKQLKESMRAAPADNSVKTLRGPQSMRGMNSKAQGKAPRSVRPSSSTGGMASKFKSRFADSDDEDDREKGQKSSFFRSRFADSDDDEPASRNVIPADLTPVRGIPRRQDQQDGDSTDLSDEDDEDARKASRKRSKQPKPIVPDSADVEKAMAAARRNLGMTNGSAAPNAAHADEGSALSKGSLRRPEPERPQSAAGGDLSPKKRGFMGSILRRNRTNSNTSQRPIASPPPPLPNQMPGSPRPGKLQRRTSAATQDRDYFNNTNPKTQPADDANWPLTPPTIPNADRPNTSDGLDRHEQAVRLARTMRPDIGRSYSNSEGAIAGGRASRVGFADDVKDNGDKAKAGGKKKKFGMLRKAFGLND